ncbi:Protein of unknown function [Aliiroseovarius sediminilitoris]|uniref:DNA primase/helicase n=1 Tax=Aliiroseovarius sediminilitoris TaxID=1173584 RepID=A0A1I0PXG5_9RHOB|nr:YfjI family protein [Aliiroseovarius sediminilitoris]SEW19251.1 Protein of unknown function [Aliiroseovarius sediminilitoris]
MVKLTPEAMNDFMKNGIGWNPRPLWKGVQPEEYPVHRLPPVIADAVREVQAYAQAPMAMVAACALSVVSAAVQTRFGVQRDAVLRGPASLYLLTVAESGERKTLIDKLFMEPLREWEAQQMREARDEKVLFEAALEAWEAAGKNPLDKPTEPRVARMLRGDDTPEALSRALQSYPIAAVITSEAGVIFGSHSMKAESVQGNLAQVNVMWDGGPISQDRIGRDSIHVERLCATMGLQVQPAVLDHFVQRAGGLARGIGYFARFLFSQPTSTRGTRFYSDPPSDMPALRAFHARVTALLAAPAVFDEFDRLVTQYISLDERAHRTWMFFHDEVEERMGGDEEYARIPDVASKAAENAARLACCYHTFSGAPEPAITEEAMVDACALMRWYLDEAVRFGQVAEMTEEVRNAEKLEEYLTQQLRMDKSLVDSGITVRTVQQKGPGPLRVRAKLDAAVELLEDHGRIRVIQAIGSKKRFIMVAPQVMKEWA